MAPRFPEATRIAVTPANAPEPITLSVHEASPSPDGDSSRAAVVFCHGFPDLAFGWRNQLEAISAAGYRAILHMDVLNTIPKFARGQLHHTPEALERGGARQAFALSQASGGHIKDITSPSLPKGGDIVILRRLDDQ